MASPPLVEGKRNDPLRKWRGQPPNVLITPYKREYTIKYGKKQ